MPPTSLVERAAKQNQQQRKEEYSKRASLLDWTHGKNNTAPLRGVFETKLCKEVFRAKLKIHVMFRSA